MKISDNKQLFIDERFIERSDGIELNMNLPVQHPYPVIVQDRPWEGKGISDYNTVLQEKDGRFRMWYGAAMYIGLPREGAIRLCYAESDDGMNWNKPSLGLVAFRGSKDNNIVAPKLERQSMQGACVFRDDRAPKEERYKLWSKFRPSDEEMKKGALQGLWAMYSPDGIHWTEYLDQPNPKDQMCDTQNMFFFDDRTNEYVGYTRVAETQQRDEAAEAEGKARYRSIGRITSPDFRTWSKTQIVLEADETELSMRVPYERRTMQPPIDFYTSCAMKYPYAQDVYLMFPSPFYHWGQEGKTEPGGDHFPAKLDVQLLTSRDGITWKRQGNRKPFISTGMDGSGTSGMIFANPWLIDAGTELWLYYWGTNNLHLPDFPGEHRTGIYRCSIRKDGFVSADAGYSGGEFTSPVFEFEGERLELNFDGGAGGWLKAEIQDSDGRKIEGFAMEDADVVAGNSLRKSVRWNGKGDVSRLAGKPVKMRFVMRDARLYAMQFV